LSATAARGHQFGAKRAAFKAEIEGNNAGRNNIDAARRIA
jgi:hypothetical protein